MSNLEDEGLDRSVDTSRSVVSMTVPAVSLNPSKLGKPLLALARFLTRNRAFQWLLGTSAQRGLIPWPILGRLRVIGTHSITSPSGHQITYVASTEDALAPSIIWKHGWESTTFRVFSDLCQNSHRIIDVGAYSGIYSLVATTENSESKVVAIEPNLEAYALLERNIAANDLESRIRTIQAAATNRTGLGTLFINHDPTQSSMLAGAKMTPHVGEVQVALVTLDDQRDEGPVDLIKIDVEGAELEVLEGGRDLIERDRPAVIVELLGELEFEVTHAFFKGFEYGPVLHLGPEGPQPSAVRKQNRNHPNYLFLHHDSPHMTVVSQTGPRS